MELPQFADFRALLPSLKVHTVFDVGANVGRTCLAYRSEWPAARIFAFEPVKATFEVLRDRVGDTVQCFNLALGDVPGQAAIQTKGTSSASRIVPVGNETIEVETGERFCSTHHIKHISFLKIDTEGFDLKVCRGFAELLHGSRIDLLQVEAGLQPHPWLVRLQDFQEFLEPLGYRVLRLYEQAGQVLALRCNAVFASAPQVMAHRKPGRKSARRSINLSNWL